MLMPQQVFACVECGHPMTLKQAERATQYGCPKCGSVDVDVA